MGTLQTYLPQDRLRALARGEAMPDHTSGAALFADISGFTRLTEALTLELGPQRGIEELSRQINAVYERLIAEVEKYGGSVLSFAGDAITCWFDGDIGLDAVASSLAMQAAMTSFSTLGLKVAVTAGPARRFVVGDPAIRCFDALAGETIARLARVEHLATRGEVLLDVATVDMLVGQIELGEWRTAESGERFAVVQGLLKEREPSACDAPLSVSARTLRPWIPGAVFDREQSGHGSLLTELRSATAVFLSFTGIDYDADPLSGEKLDSLLRSVQAVISRYEGTLMELNIGDKGSYLYASFGATVAHEDDSSRAVQAALEIRSLSGTLTWLPPLRIGISEGMMRVGAQGSTTRHTYVAAGDDVNLAARLMGNAAPGEILVSSRAHGKVADRFSFEPRPPLRLKGKAEPLPIFAANEQSRRRAVRLEAAHYALPMMGRQTELALIEAKLDLAKQGQGQVIGIVAEAGMGKSRLVAEIVRQADKRGFAGYGGACEASGVNTSYLVWKTIWQAFFDIDPSAPTRRQMRHLEGEIEDRAPDRVEAIPVLAPLLDMTIEDTDFTRTLAANDRRNVLTAVLEECLKSAAEEGPILLVLEDLHWIDAVSHDLLETLARASANLSVCIVLAYRPSETERVGTTRIERMPHFSAVTLSQLSPPEAELLIRAKLAQLFPERSGTLPKALAAALIARAEGNPFYVEELLNYLRDRDISPYDESAFQAIALPSSLQALILSRVDRLSETEKATIKTASIVGRVFSLTWLHGYYPELGASDEVKTALARLAQLDIAPLQTPEPELTYLFKHAMTRDVAYESLPHALRAHLHERLARFIESLDANCDLALLAFHYGLSDNNAKKIEYLQRAGDAAMAIAAYAAACDYFTRLLPLQADSKAQMSLHLSLGEAHFRLSNFPESRAEMHEALRRATTPADRAAALSLLATLSSQSNGDYAKADALLNEALQLARGEDDRKVLARVLYELGDANWRMGNLEVARAYLEESLALARVLGDDTRVAFALNRLGTVSIGSDLDAAERLYNESHAFALASGNRERVMAALGNLGTVASGRRDFREATDLFRQAFVLAREIGARSDSALFLLNTAAAAIGLRDLPSARSALGEGLAIARTLVSLPWILGALMIFADLLAVEGNPSRSLALLGMCKRHPAWSMNLQQGADKDIKGWNLDDAAIEAGLAQGAALDFDATVEAISNELASSIEKTT